MKKNKVSAIICAAGKGERAGFNKNKLLAPLYGAPALCHTLKKFYIGEIDEVIVTSSENDFAEISALCKPFGFKTVLGGATRTESVENALKSVTGDIVLIHDGARPFVKRELILSCIDTVKKFGSAVAAVNFTDTVALAHLGEIVERVDRNSLYAIQTPQGFVTDDIRLAYKLADGKPYTDDSAVYGEFIAPPHILEGDRENVKLTFKEDFNREYPAVSGVSGGNTVGFGVDVHAFGEGNSVTLGGVKIPFDRGLIAHSDGDVIVHAVMDALLSAAGLKDIGTYFPDTDPAFSNADSIKLLEKVVDLCESKGYTAGNLSVSVQAEKPRLAKYIDEMRKNLSKACNIPFENCAVAAGTCEKLGFVGEGLGITAYCTVLMKKV